MPDYRLTEEGQEYLQNGLPEKNLVDLLSKGPISFDAARKKIKSFDIALQWIKKKQLAEVKKGKLYLLKKVNFEEQDALSKISEGKDVDERVLKILIERKLVEKISHEIEALAKEIEGKEIVQLTPNLIKTGLWRKAKGFAPYDTKIVPTKKIFPGKPHPYRQIVNDLRHKLIGLGFVEARGPMVESEFWNFDALFMPQEHPARTSMHDAFVVKTDSQSKVLEKDLWERVKATHEFGWITGSKGWGSWNFSLARRLVLRSQTTAVSARRLASLKRGDIPHKMFIIDRVFRHDVIDAKHLIDFDHCEGIVVGKNLNFRNLLGYLKETCRMLGIEKLNFKPSYFPFTEPSAEIYAQIKGLGWVEIGGAGMMRPEVTIPLGVEEPVLAWAFGITRLAMIRLGISDIRQIYSDNIQWLREKSLVK